MISCIVPAYNEENYICRTIDSLLTSAAAPNEPIQIIVVANGSTDKTREMVLQYHGENRRALGARNDEIPQKAD